MWYRGIPGLKAYKKGYGNNDALVGLIGYRIDDLSFGYSYDITISKLAVITSLGSHEISLVYEFNNKKFAVNLLDDKESDVTKGSVLAEDSESAEVLKEKGIEKDFNLSLFILVLVFMLLLLEVFYIKRRGDL